MSFHLFKIGSPCEQYWGDLPGNSRTRFCELCQQKVHNICRMSNGERKELLSKVESGERVCVYIQPSVARRIRYFMWAVAVSCVSAFGYKFSMAQKENSGILMGMVLNEQTFTDFGSVKSPVQNPPTTPVSGDQHR